ncbi:retrovirus-related pol polyprotein from transposon TNT 1-94 [Tanacetum coccineum]
MAFLTAIASSRFPLTNNQLRTFFNPRNQATIQDGRVTVQQVQGRQGQSYAGTGYKGNATSIGGNKTRGQIRVVKCYNCQGEGHIARQCTQPKRPKNAAWFKEKAMLAEAQESGQILDEEQLAFLLIQAFQTNVSLEEPQFLNPNRTVMDNQSVISSQHAASTVIDDEETLILEELNRLSEDFGKCFVPQQELSDDQAFWLQTSHPNTDQIASSPVKIEAPKELPKLSLVNTSFKKLKYHLGQLDTVVKKQITPDAITEGEWGVEHTKTVFLNEIIPFLKTLREIFNVFDKDLLNEVREVQTVFNQMEADVQQYFLEKQCFKIHKK